MTVIAKETKVVHDPAMGIDRRVIAGQPIPPDLIEPYADAGGETSDTQPVATGQVIADRTVTVTDATGTRRSVIQGQVVPAELVEAYHAATGGEPATEPEKPFRERPVEELETLVAERGLTVEGTGRGGKITKDDLVKALEA